MNDKKGKKVIKKIIISFLICFMITGLLKQSDLLNKKEETSTSMLQEDTVLLGGMPVGIYMETQGIMILGTESIMDMEGKKREPAFNLVKSGDYIVAVNGEKVINKKSLTDIIEHSSSRKIKLDLRRNGDVVEVLVDPVEYKPEKYRLGIWVRDNVQGLGTITFLTRESKFGALGHGIHDIDTNRLIEISKGSLYKTSIHDIIKGQAGSPGSMEGIIVYNYYNKIGQIMKNTCDGVYGKIDRINEVFPEQIPIKTASKEQIKTGDAQIRCYVDGKIKNYDIQILDVNLKCRERNKGIVIKVTDKELLEKTGGIVQGMSGAPIIQNGRLIGAVTHVFVKDSTKGYGIFIENMLEEL